jgi:VWFA-related protein
MRSWLSIFLCVTLVALLQLTALPGPRLGRSGQNEQKERGQKVVLGTSEVVLDVVVRDKKGRPVKDLAAGDFEIYEDGVKQQIESFRLYEKEPRSEPATGAVEENADKRELKVEAPSAPHDPFEGVSVIALVFDRLSPGSRDLAHKAALKYVSESFKPDDLAGVFSIDLSLHIMQPYTTNTRLLIQAIDRAGTLATSVYNSSAEQSRSIADSVESTEGALESAIGGASAGPGGSGSGSVGGAGSASADLAMARMTMLMLNNFETLERDEQGYATTNSLLALISSLKGIQGRKAIIFFSEGLAIPPAVLERFRAVINAANRANVSVYPIDAAGLRVESTLAETAKEIKTMAAKRMAQQASGREDTSGQPMTRDLERNEDLLRLNPHSGLGQLADQTGGFLIKDTNNLNSGLKRIDEDMRSHYVLTYVPKNTDYDGRFRQISLKLSRTGLDVQSRQGYYAVRGAGSEPILDYEAPAIAALDSARPKDSFPVRALALSFPEPKHPGLVPVLVEAPASAFTYTIDKDKNTYSADFSIVTLIKDQAEQVISKLSQHYKLSGPADKLEAEKRGEILFYRAAELQPGNYTVEAVAYDAASGKASVRSADVEVPEGGETKLRLSSVLVLRRAERLSAADLKMDNPFHFGEALIYPNMGEPLSKSTSKELAFFFDLYTARGAAAPPKLTVEVTRSGKTVARARPDLPAADATGRIQYASALPLEKFQPGTYALKITAVDGTTSASRWAGFVVKP